MALTFPLSLDQFWGTLPFEDVSFEPLDARVFSRTRGGDVLTADPGEGQWVGQVQLRDVLHSEAARISALLGLLTRTGTFLAHPWPKCGPMMDPDGAILGEATPTLHTVAANNREVRIQALPAAYVISPGDYLSATYGSNPTRYGFLQAVTGATANGSGLTPLFEITPFVPHGLTVGAPVTLVRPVIKALIEPGSVQSGRVVGNRRFGMSFNFVQTLR